MSTSTKQGRRSFVWPMATLLAAAIFVLSSCKKNEPPPLHDYTQVNLVADVAGFGAARLDTNLVNPWGIAANPSGPIWIADNHTGLSTVYDKSGATLRPPVSIPAPGDTSAGAPAGIVFNSTPDFMTGKMPQPAKFIFATEDGTIVAWNGGDVATIMADQSTAGAVYKGLALASDGGANFLYATNFHNGTIDVFDKNFHLVSGKPFMDPDLPAGFGPFNIRNIGDKLFVTYAKQKPDKHDDQAGPGNGYIDIFSTNGMLVKRFVSQGALNSPWGIVKAAPGFCDDDGVIIVGNFGDGHINLYGEDGKFIGALQSGKQPIVIEGLWGLDNNIPMTGRNQLFFTAGPGEESHGIFGYIRRGN
ncbi:TIGR03118 family protein [Chitinophaga vietnamensis]|uniref:TIGR03118 family protein n=1 Tax=Chitinophaga vietnamensis TaxID=2593957 RepID=UPI0011782EFB|nr:TIGR03118 family protein [Chitinophaga vietnamensis]